MSCNINVHTRHEIDYGGQGFTWAAEELKNALKSNGADIRLANDEDAYSDWEIEADSLHVALANIKSSDKSTFEKTFNLIKEYTVSKLEEFVRTGDRTTGYYHFSWL